MHALQDLLRRPVAVSVQSLQHPACRKQFVKHIGSFRHAVRIDKQLVASAKMNIVVRIFNIRKYADSDVVLGPIELKGSALAADRRLLVTRIDKS